MVLEIGGDIGALIMYLDEELERTEISIEWEVDPSKDVHTGVWRRTVGTTNAVMAVYSELVEGRYFVPALNGHPAQSVDIRGGHVEEIDLRTR